MLEILVDDWCMMYDGFGGVIGLGMYGEYFRGVQEFSGFDIGCRVFQ